MGYSSMTMYYVMGPKLVRIGLRYILKISHEGIDLCDVYLQDLR